MTDFFVTVKIFAKTIVILNVKISVKLDVKIIVILNAKMIVLGDNHLSIRKIFLYQCL